MWLRNKIIYWICCIKAAANNRVLKIRIITHWIQNEYHSVIPVYCAMLSTSRYDTIPLLDIDGNWSFDYQIRYGNSVYTRYAFTSKAHLVRLIKRKYPYIPIIDYTKKTRR